MPSMFTQVVEAKVKAVVQRHRVVFEVLRALEVVDGKRLAVGYDLELRGAHPRDGRGLLPGCQRCEQVWADLAGIAYSLWPAFEDRATTFRVDPFDRALLAPPPGRDGVRDEVRLTLRIRHWANLFAPDPEGEERCVRELREALRSIGACEGSWSRSAAARAAGYR